MTFYGQGYSRRTGFGLSDSRGVRVSRKKGGRGFHREYLGQQSKGLGRESEWVGKQAGSG
jgi:hypothetical protein